MVSLPNHVSSCLRGCMRLRVLALAALTSVCGPTQPTSTSMAGILSATPTAIGDGWALSTLRDERIDTARLESLAQRIQGGRYGRVDALVIARNGRLCYDAYFSGSPTAIHELQSVTKSVTSALVGAAVARGAIASAQQPVAALLPDF